MARKKVIVIGAGIGGITTATYLAKAGYDVHIYEQSKNPGGRASQHKAQGFTFDTGPSWYLMPEVFEHYFSLCGTSTEEQLDLIKLDPAYRVFFEDGTHVTIGNDQKKNQAAFEAMEPGAGGALKRYAEQAMSLYNLSLKHFLYTNFQSVKDILHLDIFRALPLFLRMVSSSFDSEVSRFVTHPRLKMILEYSCVFLGASPYKAPALYTLMGALDFHQGVYYPKGGIYALIERMVALSEQAGVTYHYEQSVKQIVVKHKKAAGVTLSSDETIEADIVISNADLHHTETAMLPENLRSYSEKYWQKQQSGPSALLLYLGVEGSLPELAHHDLCFVDSWKENFEAIYETKTIPNPASIYISKTTATEPNLAPKGHEALVVLVPLPADKLLSKSEQQQLERQVYTQMEQMTGVKNIQDRIVYKHTMGPAEFGEQFQSWRYSMLGPGHTLRQSAIFRTRNYSKKVKNLYYVGGGTIPGVGMPMCMIGAELIYKRIIGDKQGGPVQKITNHSGASA